MIRLTREQVREVDRRSIEEYGIPGIVLMENAARELAAAASGMLGGDAEAVVAIAAGPGNNGGDALAVARHLHNRGVRVRIVLVADASKFEGDALTNWRIVEAMHLPVADPNQIARPALWIDGLFGTGLSRPIAGPAAQLIDTINRCGSPVLAIDIPSGLDCDTGRPLSDVCVRATKTVTFVAEKAGFANPESKQYTGEVTVGDIGCPRELIEFVAQQNRPPLPGGEAG